MEIALVLAQLAAAIFKVAQETAAANAQTELERQARLAQLDAVLLSKVQRGPIPPIPPAEGPNGPIG